MAEIVVRALETPAEVDTFFRVATQEFFPQAELEAVAAGWRQYVEENPGFQSSQLRGAFRGRNYLGGYLIYDRQLRLGPARLRTCCIGAVVTHPPEALFIKLSPQRFTQLLFGYRPITWLAHQPGQQISPELFPVLDILFPLGPAWIAGTDQF